MRKQRTCAVADCGRPVIGRDMCSKHYQRLVRNGSVELKDRGAGAILRFKALIDAGPRGCWNWTGTLTHNGYGRFNPDGKSVRAHRWSYTRWVGPVPPGQMVLHHCDNRRCVNPAHLFLGGAAANSQDMVQKDRGIRGIRNPRARITFEIAEQIRADYAKPGATQGLLADRYGVSSTTIHRVVTYAERGGWHLP